jgi:hypothetical protein
MAGYVEGVDRGQATLFSDRLDDVVDADNPVRVIDAFVEALDCTNSALLARCPRCAAGSTSTCSTRWKSGSLAGQS